jgi:adenylate kinase family enzyme
MKRVAIIGPGGSGKSALARRLGDMLGLEVIHLDALFWKPGWVETPYDEWRRTVEGLAGRQSWIIDGNYGRTMEVRLAAADTVIFLDLPRLTCLWRVIKRLLQYRDGDRPDMAPGCNERFGLDFLRFLKWIWGYRTRSRPRVLGRLERFSEGKQVHILRRPGDAKSFLEDVERGRRPQGFH